MLVASFLLEHSREKGEAADEFDLLKVRSPSYIITRDELVKDIGCIYAYMYVYVRMIPSSDL